MLFKMNHWTSLSRALFINSMPEGRGIRGFQDALRGGHLLAFYCRWCSHTGRFDPQDIVHAAGEDLTLAQLGEVLKCSNCGRQGATVLVSDDFQPSRD